MVKDLQDPVLLHVVTEKGHGFQPAEADPVFFHTPPVFVQEDDKAVPKSASSRPNLHALCMRTPLPTRCVGDSQGHRADRRHVSGQQTGAGAGRIPRSLLRYGDL